MKNDPKEKSLKPFSENDSKVTKILKIIKEGKKSLVAAIKKCLLNFGMRFDRLTTKYSNQVSNSKQNTRVFLIKISQKQGALKIAHFRPIRVKALQRKINRHAMTFLEYCRSLYKKRKYITICISPANETFKNFAKFIKF